jgi:DNA polymerase III epsilon subunit-like protein
VNLAHLHYAAFDVETTGLSADARITEAAVTHLDPGRKPRLAYAARCNPGIPMERGATLTTGITDDDLKDCPPWVEIGPNVMAALEGRVVIAYNSPYDFRRLCYDSESAGLPVPTWGGWIDPLIPLKARDLYGNNKLKAVCEARGIVVDAHGAAGDTMATAILWSILLREFDLGNVPLDRYLARQRQRALEQEAGFVAWALKKGSFRERPECAWHELEGEPLPYWPETAKPVGRCQTCSSPAIYKIEKTGDLALFNPDDTPHICPE